MNRLNTHKSSLLLLIIFSLLLTFVPAGSADPVMFIRGDANNDQQVNISDPVYILSYLFLAGTKPACLDAADSNDDGSVNITDVMVIVDTLFLGKNEIAAFYPNAFYDWTTNDPDVCGDIPAWLKEMLQNPNQPAADPAKDPFEGPGVWDNSPAANPIMQAVAMIRLMSPMEWDIVRNMNPNLYEILTSISKLTFERIEDYGTLLDILQSLSGWDVTALVNNGVPLYVANALAPAIETAQTTTAPDLQSADQQQTQSLEDSLKGLSPGLKKINNGPDANPDDAMFCYICGSGCNQGGTSSGTGTDQTHQCGMKVAYDIYFSPASTPGPSAMNFVRQLVNQSKESNASEPCCKHYVYVRIPNTSDSVASNGKAAADEMKAELNKIAGNAANGDQCVREIVLNLYCFSASCIEVINFVKNLEPCDIPCPGCTCCSESYDKITKKINIVSMEGVFNGAPGIFGGIANLCTGAAGLVMDGAGIPGAYACSAISEQYGGEEPPCVCSFNAYSRDPGAGSTDPNLSEWNITSHQISADSHADFPNAMIQDPQTWSDIAPRCGCKNTTPPQ